MSTVNLFHGTGIKHEEDFTGFVVRQAELSDVNNHRGVMAVMDKVHHRPAFVHPSNIEGIASLFPGSLPGWESLVMNHTRYRLNSAFLPESKSQALLEQYRLGTLPGSISHVPKHKAVLRGRLQICRSCMESDFATHGHAIWHRLHLMPSIRYCPKHKEALMTFAPGRDVSHRRSPPTWHPRHQCPRGDELRALGRMTNHDSVEAAVAIAQMAQEVLEGHIDTSALAENTGPILRRKIRHIAHTSDRRDYHQVAQENLEWRLGAELTPLLGFAGHTFVRVTGHEASDGPLINPVQNIAAIWSLFGGWHDFLNEVNAREVSPKEYDAQARIPPKYVRRTPDKKIERWRRNFEQLDAVEMEHYREQCRSAILAGKTLTPTFTRNSIIDLPDGQKLAFFAFHYDRNWFDENLPSQSRKSALPKVVARKQTLEAKKMELVRQRYEDTIRHDPRRRISRAFLLSETGSESAYKRGTGTPELESLLDQCADKYETWRDRQIELHTSLAKKVDKDSKWATRKTYEGRSKNAFSKRICRAREWIEKNKD
ncbi:TniQ protein [Paraburkholderia sp. BL23I1N1]|uniref:TniQ family protein n=1 Tax=Paraburkholderia sp. BL23I1N1 TaxID=1938802 RepID=UPI000E732036|nr:TniQ family protein [Paraburkholderia sp. BL23I1N1]RKE25182.1 TniQ protein [Paraburkholderia sp. BL23I1N1]